MQRHGQKRRARKGHFSKRSLFYGQSRQQGENDQVHQAPQQKRRCKAQVQAERQKYACCAEYIQNRVGIGLLFKQPHMIAQLVGSAVGHVVGKFLPGKHSGFLILDHAVKIAWAAVGIKNRYILHHPFIAAHTVGPPTGNGKAFIDMKLLVRCRVRGQRHGKSKPKSDHKPKNRCMQCKVMAADKKVQPAQNGGEQQGGRPVIQAQKAADGSRRNILRQRAVYGSAVQHHGLTLTCSAR